jgi:mRNA interferase MazF
MEHAGRGRGLEGLVKGDIVILDFPFSDLSARKRRPALVLRPLQYDAILLPITTSLSTDEYAVVLGPDDFAEGGLRAASLIRSDTIFTADKTLILGKAGRVRDRKLREVVGRVVTLLQG